MICEVFGLNLVHSKIRNEMSTMRCQFDVLLVLSTDQIGIKSASRASINWLPKWHPIIKSESLLSALSLSFGQEMRGKTIFPFRKPSEKSIKSPPLYFWSIKKRHSPEMHSLLYFGWASIQTDRYLISILKWFFARAESHVRSILWESVRNERNAKQIQGPSRSIQHNIKWLFTCSPLKCI